VSIALVLLAVFAVVLLAVFVWRVLVPALSKRRLASTSARRILFPFLGTALSRSTLDAAMRLARSEHATLVPAYLAIVRHDLSLEAPIRTQGERAMPLLEAVEQRAARLELEVDSRIERGRSPRHALAELIAHERFDTLVLPAATEHSDGFAPDDVAWALENAPGEVVVVRPAAAPRA
jgi:Universal stress protein family